MLRGAGYRLLRHKVLKNTQKYIHWAETIFGSAPDDEYITKVSTTLQEFCKLLEEGFAYVSDYGDPTVKVLRKRKQFKSKRLYEENGRLDA